MTEDDKCQASPYLMKKNKLSILKRKADKALSIYVRKETIKRYGKCPICNVRPVQCCFHFITRKRAILRWDKENVIGSCRTCNYVEQFFPDVSRAWYIRTFGVNKYLKLVHVAEQKFIITENYLKEIIRRYS